MRREAVNELRESRVDTLRMRAGKGRRQGGAINALLINGAQLGAQRGEIPVGLALPQPVIIRISVRVFSRRRAGREHRRDAPDGDVVAVVDEVLHGRILRLTEDIEAVALVPEPGFVEDFAQQFERIGGLALEGADVGAELQRVAARALVDGGGEAHGAAIQLYGAAELVRRTTGGVHFTEQLAEEAERGDFRRLEAGDVEIERGVDNTGGGYVMPQEWCVRYSAHLGRVNLRLLAHVGEGQLRERREVLGRIL